MRIGYTVAKGGIAMCTNEEKTANREVKNLRICYSVKDILSNVPDFDPMDDSALRDYLTELEKALEKLDACEPKNENSDAYEEWAIEHEDLEDLMDEVLDLLDER